MEIRASKLRSFFYATPVILQSNAIEDTQLFPIFWEVKQWKRENVTPVHKKDDKQLIKKYRPISLLPIFFIFIDLYNHLTRNKLITENQSGFRTHDSVTNQLTFLVHEIFGSFNQNVSGEVRSVFLDMSKAFDKVWP